MFACSETRVSCQCLDQQEVKSDKNVLPYRKKSSMLVP